MRMFIARLALGFVVSIAVTSTGAIARAENCSGNPDALGTSRVLALVSTDYPRWERWPMRLGYHSPKRRSS